MAGVILETYQGGSAAFAPVEYMKALRAWCNAHKVLLVCDEVQAGFGEPASSGASSTTTSFLMSRRGVRESPVPCRLPR